MTLAQVSPTIWVFGMDAKADMEAVERGGYGAGGKQFSASLSEVIAAQVPANASAWFATSDEAWSEKPGTKLVVGTLLKKPEWLFVLARGRAAVASLCFENPSRLRLVVRAADEATGQRLRDYFRAQATATEGAQHGGAGTLALFETGFDPATTFATLERFFADAGRK